MWSFFVEQQYDEGNDLIPFSIITLNIEGMKGNNVYLDELIKSLSPNVVALQETWIFSYQQTNTIPDEYDISCKCIDNDQPVTQSYSKRASAGTANIWKGSSFSPVADGNHRFCILEDSRSGMVIINTYLPPRSCYVNADFKEAVDQLHELCTKFCDSPVILLGDLNIDFHKKIDSRAKYLKDLLVEFQFHEVLDINTPTFHQHNGCETVIP